MKGLDEIKVATWVLHRRAESGGIVAAILAGRATRQALALLWRNLLPVYQALDATPLGWPAIVRSTAIAADLALLAPGEDLPLLPEAVAYADRISAADDAGQIGHAYVRYLGDLNGGRIIQRRLEMCLGPVATALAFNAYPKVDNIQEFVGLYRTNLDCAIRESEWDRVAAEAEKAFELNIALSEAIADRFR